MNKLIVFDMDGVIFEHLNFWHELHKKFGTFEEGKKLTEKYVKTNYAKLVEEVVGRLWKGKNAKPYFELVNGVKYVSGAKETVFELKKKGYKTAIISSGSSHLAERAKKELGIDYIYTNELVIRDNVVSGEFIWPIAHNRKAVALRKLCEEHNVDFKDCIVVGHDDNDIRMARIAGFAIAFCPESDELKKYCNVVIKKRDLREILKHIEEFERSAGLLGF